MACDGRSQYTHEHTHTHTHCYHLTHIKPSMHRNMRRLRIHTHKSLLHTDTHTRKHTLTLTLMNDKSKHTLTICPTHTSTHTHTHTHTHTDRRRQMAALWIERGDSGATLRVVSMARRDVAPGHRFFFILFFFAAETRDWVSSSQRWQITRPWQSNPDRIKRRTISQRWQPTAGRQTEDRRSLRGDKDTEMAEEIGHKVKEVL